MLVNPLVDEGYPSIGCAPCTVEAAAGCRPAQRPLGRTGQDRMRAARDDARTTALDALDAPGVRVDPHLPRGRGRVRPPGDPVLRRQGLDAAGAPGRQGLRARRRCRSRCCTSTPGTTTRRSSTSATGSSSGSGLRLEVAHVQDWIDDGRLVERPDGTRNPLQTVPLLDAINEHRFDAVFGGGRRDEERARAKERISQPARRVRPVGPAQAAPGAVEPLQRPARPGRARAGVPDLQLDRAGRLALHPAREHRAAVDLLRPPAAGVPPRRHVAGRGPVGRPARRRGAGDEDRALPHRRRRVLHRRRRVRRRRRSTRSSPRSRRRG